MVEIRSESRGLICSNQQKKKRMALCLIQQKKKMMSEISSESGEFEEDIMFGEILPRLPMKSLFRFKLVSKTWLNFLTHDPLFPHHHHHHSHSNSNSNSNSIFFSFRSGIFLSSSAAPDTHPLNWSMPSFMVPIHDHVKGTVNGLIYGQCFRQHQLFISNPLTKHTLFISKLPLPNPISRSGFLRMGLACDPRRPAFGFTIVCLVFVSEDMDKVQFCVYSSKTAQWRVPQNASLFLIPSNPNFTLRYYNAAYLCNPNKRVYFSLRDHVVWFDIEKDVPGVTRCPNNPDFVRLDPNPFRSEIGVCDGDLTYTRMTRHGDIEIWLLRHNDGNNSEYWVKKHTVGLMRIVEENWDTMFESICQEDVMMNTGDGDSRGMNAAKVVARAKPLPYSGGEEVWFLIEFLRYFMKAFSFNLRTRELKLINKDGTIEDPLYPFVPTLLPCPS